ncbi:hypothetical protein ASH01_05025 [Terrabacter sp. Soil811]|uniref:hypothetical protein n=1 Tax=Terrabacter sp. Soil811 TaxID=1736419 RepID=UPI0006F432D5|nr:hypothetical protein [Terrabacter sp. Soil811]KRF49013.1 hypothetical protein ASH01_05025 [Terrabacter sp. Soil811]
MSASTTSTHRWQLLLGVALTIVVALGSAFVLTGASRGAVPAVQSAASQPLGGDCPDIGSLVAAASTTTASTTATTATTHGASAAAVRAGLDTVLFRARGLARTTASDDARESMQNLADDLAAYRLSVTRPATDRHADIAATVRADLTALRRLCGH